MTTTPPLGKGARIASWILSVLLALVFLGSGIGKLLAQQQMVDNFARWGFPRWFLPLTGLCEIAGAVLIAIPRTRAFGGALLVCVMAGAVITHLTHGEAKVAPFPAMLGVLAGVVAWLNRPPMLRGAQPSSS